MAATMSLLAARGEAQMTRTVTGKPEFAGQLAEERRRVDFDSYDITVQQLVSMVSQNQIDVAPAYQRRFRWDPKRQSQLIESIFLGIPVPNLFMATNANGTWEVVDGVQRLTTIVNFAGDDGCRRVLGMSDPLKIQELEKLSALNGLGFQDLPQSVQLQFMLRPVKVTTLSDKSDLKVRFDLFERLNTGGMQLTDQEIRGCIYRGQFNDFLERLASSKDFRKVVRLRQSTENDGTREEYVLRFFAFLNGYRTFEHSVVGFLNDYMAAASKSFDYEKGEKEFTRTFAELAAAFPNGLGRRTRLTPVNLFEAVAVGAALVLKRRPKLKTKALRAWIDSDELRRLTTGATNNKKMVVGRIDYVAERFRAG
jgi:hypothetical protein